jgi:hypothetical protein
LYGTGRFHTKPAVFFFSYGWKSKGICKFFLKSKKKETQPTTFDNEDLSWMDLYPQTHQENVCTDVATVSLPSGPGESSQAWNPPVESTHVEDVDDDSECES